MIVRYESDGSLVMITQNDHAQLAGLLAAHWGNGRFDRPRPYGSLVRAAMFHDKGWIRYETNPHYSVESGKTPNYRDVPNDQEQLAAFQWAGDWMSGIDNYAGLLVSKHRTGLWQSRYGVITKPAPIKRGTLGPEIRAFIERNEVRQKATEASLDPRELAVNYNLLQVWDLLSLYICSQERIKEDFIEPVPTGYANGELACMRLSPQSPTSIAVDPFPFDQPALPVSLVYRRLRQSSFRDADAFRTAYFMTAPELARFTFVNGGGEPH
jgi:hypothetical protein